MKVWKLTRDNYSYVVAMLSDLWPELDNMEEGEDFELSCEEMPEEEFANLPEFEGW